MEDKELQELFDAKRWQLENRQQQEAIAAAVGGYRHRWLGWTTAAAAAIAAVLLLMPSLHQEPEAAPMQVAQVKEPLPLPTAQNNNLSKERIVKKEAIKGIEERETTEGTEAIETIDIIDTILIENTDIQNLATQPEGTRIHRRRGNLLAETVRLPEKPKVPPLIAHYLDIPDSIEIAKNIVIQF